MSIKVMQPYISVYCLIGEISNLNAENVLLNKIIGVEGLG